MKNERRSHRYIKGEVIMPEFEITCKLSEIMGRHRITQTALAKASGLRPGTISALYHDRTCAITKSALADLIRGLRSLSDMDYDAADVLHFGPVIKR